MKKIIIGFCFILSITNLPAQKLQSYQDENTGKYGYKDANGKIAVKPVYAIAHDFEDNPFACVNIGAYYDANIGGKWGAIDAKGKVIIPVKYDNIRYIGYNLFAVKVGEIYSNMDASAAWEGKYAIFNSSGKALTSFVYSGSLSGVSFENGFAILEIRDTKTKNIKYGLLDSTGKIALPVKYDDINLYSEDGLILLGLNGKYGYADRKLKTVIPVKFEDANIFSEGLASVKINGKWGFIDKAGKEIITPQYEDADVFEEGFVGVKQNGKWGVVDKENKQLLPFNYDAIVWIHKGGNDIRVKLGQKYIHLDRNGKEVKQ